MITKYVQLWFVVPKHQVEVAWTNIVLDLAQRGCGFINLPDGRPAPPMPLAGDWSDLPPNLRPAFAKTEAEWERYVGNRRDIKIISFIMSSLGRSIEDVLADWQALNQEVVFVGGSWATGFDAPDPLDQWNYAGRTGHPEGGSTFQAVQTR